MNQPLNEILYPPTTPYDHGTLEVGSGHTLYYEQVGTAGGTPIVFLHGGPGGGGDVNARRFFDPDRHRAILFDQRGCGRSRPLASLEDNTTWHLIADIERLRQHLGIDRWLVFGGSWGSTLALAYAETHPDAVAGLVLRGLFLLRRQELEWFYQHGASELFPERFSEFLAPIEEAERGDMLGAYHRGLNSGDAERERTLAKAWSVWEARTSTLRSNPALVKQFGNPHFALGMARLECHYFVNHCFIEPNQILDQAARLQDIPGVIVQGRYDVVCPMDQAYALHQAWSRSRIEIIEAAGHSAAEPGIVDALVRATDAFAGELA